MPVFIAYFVSAHRVQIATPASACTRRRSFFVSAHRVQIATAVDRDLGVSRVFVSAHRVQIATANVHKAPRADLWNAL